MRIFQSANGIGIGLVFWMMAWTPLCASAIDIHGRISDSITGESIAGAVIKVYAYHDDVEPVAAIASGSDGTYAWSGDLEPGRIGRLIASAFGHWPDTLYFDTSSDYPNANVALLPAPVAGFVRDATGAPVANAPVQTWVREEGSSAWTVGTSVRTGADGSYQLREAPGTYRICAGGLLSGLVQQCYDGIPVRQFSDIDAATPVVLGEGETRHDIDFALTAGASLAGSLSDERSGAAIAWADVTFELYDAGGNRIDTGRQRSDDSGAYRLQGVPSGTFYLSARVASQGVGGTQLYSGIACPHNDCSQVIAKGEAIGVADGDSVDHVDFSFGPEAVLRGRVSDVVDGRPVPNAWVAACYNDTWIIMTYCPFATSSDADGRYEIAVNVRPYYFVKVHADPTHVDQVYPDASCLDESCNHTGGSVFVESGDVLENIDFALRRSSTLAGRVVDSRTGAPLPYALISGYGADDAVIWQTTTDQDGRYVGGKWLAGTYYVSAYYYAGPSSQCRFYLDRPCPRDGEPISSVVPTPVTLAAEEHREGIDFALTDPPIFADGFDGR